MGILIDTGVLIDAERGRADLGARLEVIGDERAYLSVITASELLASVHRAADPWQRARRTAFVEQVLRQIPAIPIDLAVARIHAEIHSTLAAAGTSVGAHDLWIAASAVTHGLTVVTTNPRDLSRVPGLCLLDVRLAS